MADEQKGSQETLNANSDADDQTDETGRQKVDETGQKADTGQADYVPKQDYKNLESRFGQSQTELKQAQEKNEELEGRMAESERFQEQVQNSFSPKQSSDNTQRELTAIELRAKADEYRELYPDTAAIFDEQANNRAWRDKQDSSITTEQQLHNLYGELSKDESPIKPDSVDWRAVGKIASDHKIDAKAAYGMWLGDNFGRLTTERIEQEKATWDKANRARGFEGDYDIPVTDAEKKEIAKAHAEFGEPGKWPKDGT